MKFMIIDIHAHVFPEKIAEKASHGIQEFYNITVPYNGTVDKLIELSDDAGVDKMVIHSPATTPHQVSSINNFIIECAKKYPDRIIGFMTMHPDFDDINAEVERCAAAGLKGLKIHPDFQRFMIDDKKAYNIYEAISGRLPLLVHTGDYRYQWSKPSRMAAVMDDFPALQVIGAHFGGWSEWDDAAEVFSGKNIYVDSSSTMYKVPPEHIKELIRLYGADHVLFGTDYPMWDAKSELEHFEKLNLSASERELIFHENAESLLKL